MISNDVLIKNRFLSQVRTDWERAFTYAKLTLRKDFMPIEIIFPKQFELIFAPAHDSTKHESKHATEYMIRIKGKGLRRIYWGYEVIQADYDATNNRFTRTVSGNKKCSPYKCVEVDAEFVVVFANFKNT